jgi:hypothetical protein
VSAFHYGDAVPPALREIAERVETTLGGSVPGIVVAVGADDPGLAARLPEGPRVVVPALRSRAVRPWARSLLRSAAATVLFDPSEARGLVRHIRSPVVVAGVPRPEAGATAAAGVSVGPAGERVAAIWRSELGPVPVDGVPVAWLGGAAPLAEAAAAWARGSAAVCLPGTPRHDMLRDGGALATRSSLEVIEATRYLRAAAPLAHELSRRGRRQLARLDTIDGVAERVAEALLIATEAA